jgi:2-polyprenyl-6-methoxyphenol hydroxylase-like FAD-dependent oxidoreductase
MTVYARMLGILKEAKMMTKEKISAKTTDACTDVLIVGAGPAGLSLAVELGSQGKRCMVVERHEHVGYAPRAKTSNVRTRELFRRWGIADRLAAESPFGVDYPSNVVFATRMNGYELHRFPNAFNCSPARDERYSEHAQWIPQYKVEAVLKARTNELPGVEIRFKTGLENFTDHGDHVTAVLRDIKTGALTSVEAAYIIGADGARSTVRAQLGIKMSGTSPLSHNHNIIFRAPGLAERHGLGRAVMYWLVNKEVPSVIAPLDSGDRWTFACPILSDNSSDPALLIRKALGFDIDIEILSRDEWTAHQLIAERYGSGRAFLIGDACHLHPPFGGYGMNMGIGDALDLGWKLSAVLAGWGGDALLPSYEIERRQVHQRVIEESVANHAASTTKLVVAGIEDAGNAGDAIRADVGVTIASTKRREFYSLGVVLGSRYRHSPVLPGQASRADQVAESTDYTPLAHVGCLAPHLWLDAGDEAGASLYDHFSSSGFTLLVTTQSAVAAAGFLVQAAAGLGVPLKLLVQPVKKLNTLYGCDYALIRPDHYIAWCGDSLDDAADMLALVAGKSLEPVT